MAKGKGGASSGGGRNDGRPNGKAQKKHPKVFDAQKRRLVTKQ